MSELNGSLSVSTVESTSFLPKRLHGRRGDWVDSVYMCYCGVLAECTAYNLEKEAPLGGAAVSSKPSVAETLSDRAAFDTRTSASPV